MQHLTARDDFTLWTICSGSSGNAVYLRVGSSAVLVDVGCSARTACQFMQKAGEDLPLCGIFITHEHIDHIRGLPVLSRRCNVPIHATEGSAPYIGCEKDRVTVHPPCFCASAGDIEVTSFPTPHDSHMSVGYLLRADGLTVGVATDIGHMTDEIMSMLTECDALILESNHDIAMLEHGSYPYPLKQRILSARGHLSNDACAAALVTLTRERVRHVMLAHLSEENNTPEIAWRTSDAALESCGTAHRVRLAVADRRFPTRLL